MANWKKDVPMLAAELGAHIVSAESYPDLLRSLPHWGIELTVEAVTGLVVYPLGRRLLRRHDRKHHGMKQDAETAYFDEPRPEASPRLTWQNGYDAGFKQGRGECCRQMEVCRHGAPKAEVHWVP